MRSITVVRATLAALLAILFACADGDEAAEQTISLEDTTAAEPVEARAYWNPEPALTQDDIEAGRLDTTWLRIARADTARFSSAPLDTFETAVAGPPGSADSAPIRIEVASSFPESYADLEALATPDSAPVVHVPIAGDAQGPSVLRVQVLLDRGPYSPGILDGKWGKNTSKAVYWLQRAEGLEATGEVDSLTFARLERLAGGAGPAVRTVRLTEEDVAGPFVDIPEDVHAQAELECMCYESALEQVAERHHAAPELLERLNPGRALDALRAGDSLRVPAIAEQSDRGEVAEIVISGEGFYLHALDADGRILYHFPTTLGSRYQPSPSGDYEITSIAFDPWFHWQPALFDEVPDDVPDARIPPGPNSPVGVVWMQLSAENYGIHGTRAPATIGYVTSHGCVRLTNWDARFLAERTSAGVPVSFRDVSGPEVARR